MLLQFFFEFAPAVLFVPLFLSLWYYKHFPAALKNISYYMIVSAVTQVLSYIFWKQSKNNFPILHVYTVVEYLLLLKFYHSILKGFLSTVVYLCLLIIIPLFFITDSLFIENIHTYNTFSRSIEALVIIFLAMCCYIKIVSDDREDSRLQKPLKFINSAFLIYFSGSVMLFSFASSFAKLALKLSIGIWALHTLLAVTLYTLIALGLWKYRKQ